MSFGIDAIIIILAVSTVFSATRRGFIRSAMGLVTTAASLIAAYAYTPVLAAYIKDKYITDRVALGISNSLKSLSLDTTTDLYNLDKLAADLPEPFTNLLDRYSVSIDSFLEKIRGITGGTANVVDDIAVDIADRTAQIIASALSFILLFFAALLILHILTAILDMIFKLPVLKTANTLLGFVFGVIQAVILVAAVSVAIAALVNALVAVDPAVFSENTINDTVICKFVLEHNIFSGLFSLN